MQASSPHPPPLPGSLKDSPSRNLYTLGITAFISLLLLILLLITSSSSSSTTPSSPPTSPLPSAAALLSLSGAPSLPSIAYLLSGSDGDADRLLRLLHAAYHPRNLYLLHLDLTAPQPDRDRLALAVRAAPTFRSAANVHVVGRPDAANPRGSSALAATLHAAAILLRLDSHWDWFVNLDASDYPLVTQDDLLHVLSYLPRDLNFVQHSSRIGWRESRRMRPIVVDPGLYHSSKVDIFYATQKRDLPNAYRLFSGSGSVILSHKFIEYCILGTDNLPRTTLMYYANMLSSHKNYFQTVLCNSPVFNRTVVNHNLQYALWDKPPKQVPRELSPDEFKNASTSGAAFATGFSHKDLVLDRIDKEILGRGPNQIVPGGWCLGQGEDPCTVWGNANILRPGPGATKLVEAITKELSHENFQSHQCIW